MFENLIYTIPKNQHTPEELKDILLSHPEIKFVSLIGIDLSGHDTDEKIPIKNFIKDIPAFIKGAIQTDGSSVVLPGIATLNNAKVDMVVDTNVNWFVDYNYENIDFTTKKPIGTLRIPCFLYHDNTAVDSRHILKDSIDFFKSSLLDHLKSHPKTLEQFNIKFDDIETVEATSATELEFWVKSPNDKTHVEELTTSEALQEQYWTRTKGIVRTCLEQSLMAMEDYGFEPEMGHKEVGGVKSKIDKRGHLNHIMEQLEIDWKYSNPLQTADNEVLIRTLIKEIFGDNGLEVTFLAKPLHGVAGSGKHIHVGAALKLKNGKRINLFNTNQNHFLSTIGYGAMMGILKNYEIINPFVSATNDSLRRLKPGFEAPVCVATSLGHSVDIPSRNRTILLALIRDLDSPLATRFELRSPNPHTNTYLTIAAIYMTMLDGIKYALENNKTDDELLNEISKKPNEQADYLEYSRAYRSEDDIFEAFNDKEREDYFGNVPKTIYENIESFKNCPDKLKVLEQGNVFNHKIINSFTLATIGKWSTEISSRILAQYAEEIRSYKMLHSLEKALDLDVANWMKINELRIYLMKDTYTRKSLFTRIREAIDCKDYAKVSNLQLEIDEKMTLLRNLYTIYKRNLLDIIL